MDQHMELYQMVEDFRKGIEQAQKANEFMDDVLFRNFPRACCGDTSLLLGHYLLGKGIKTYYVCGYYGQGDFGAVQSHAWLMTEDGIIIDITGDQFRCKTQFYNYNIPVCVGEKGAFHNLFVVEKRNIRLSVPLNQISCLDEHRLPDLYRTIMKYI